MKNYKKYILSSMLAALIFVFTMFVRVPSFNGYVHIGDSILYLASALLPLPFSVFAACAGTVLADIISGYIIYAPATLIIKGLMALCISSKGEKILTKRNIMAIFLASVVNIVGYFLCEMVLFQAKTFGATLLVAAHTIPGNFAQSFSACLIFVFAALFLDKMNFKGKLSKI